MIQKISFLILWMVSVNLQAFEILNVKEGAVVTIRVPEEDVDYYEHGEIYYVVNSLNLAIVQKVEILSAKKQIVRFKCVNQCNRQLKKGAVFSLEDGPSQKSRDSKTFSVEKNKSLKFGYGYPIRSAFSGFEFARESYELDNISGFILNLQMLWRSIEPDSEVRFLGLGFFVSNISGKAKTNEGNLEVDYEVTGISIPIGVHFSKIGDWQFGLGMVKRIPLSQDFRIKAFGKTQKSQPTTNRFSLVDEIQYSVVYSIDEASRIVITIDDEFFFPEVQPILNFTTWGDRVGVGGLHIGYEYEI